jgi:hypothetical protein
MLAEEQNDEGRWWNAATRRSFVRALTSSFGLLAFTGAFRSMTPRSTSKFGMVNSSKEDHEESLQNDEVRALVEKGRPMIASVVPTITNAVGGKGIS